MTTDAENRSQLDLVWGTAEIGKVIGRSHAQVHHMVTKGELPAKKINGRWCAERGQLTKWFLDQLSAEGS